MPSIVLTIYRLKDQVTNRRDALKDQENLSNYNAIEASPLDAEFWAPRIKEGTPPWVSSVRNLFVGVEEYKSKSPRGVVLISRGGFQYAIPFGNAGHTLIDRSTVLRSWGKRIALNLLYDTSGKLIDNGERLRRERSTKLGRGLDSHVQSSKAVSLDVFEFNQVEELLKSITVEVNRDSWGATSLAGSDPVSIRWNRPLSEVGPLCDELENAYSRNFYKKHFDFIDHINTVTDKPVLDSIWAEVGSRIGRGNLDGLGLNPSIAIDVASTDLRLYGVSDNPMRGGHVIDHLDLQSYKQKLDDLRAPVNIFSNSLRVLNEDGEEVYSDPIRRWLDGSLVIGEKTYALSEGEVYEVGTDFLSGLDLYLDNIDSEAARVLNLPVFSSVPKRPIKKKDGTIEMKRDERAYNEEVGRKTGFLCMDGNNVITIPRRTKAIEFCDILSSDNKELIFTKRGIESSSMSYLLGQAMVSTELFISEREFRKDARKRVASAARSARKPSQDFLSAVPLDLIHSGEHMVTLLIIGKWKDRSGQLKKLSRYIPFFGKIALRRAVQILRSRAFGVRVGRVCLS